MDKTVAQKEKSARAHLVWYKGAYCYTMQWFTPQWVVRLINIATRYKFTDENITPYSEWGKLSRCNDWSQGNLLITKAQLYPCKNISLFSTHYSFLKQNIDQEKLIVHVLVWLGFV